MFVDILSKARIADIPSDLSNPLNYYTVLYSFLITRYCDMNEYQ